MYSSKELRCLYPDGTTILTEIYLNALPDRSSFKSNVFKLYNFLQNNFIYFYLKNVDFSEVENVMRNNKVSEIEISEISMLNSSENSRVVKPFINKVKNVIFVYIYCSFTYFFVTSDKKMV